MAYTINTSHISWNEGELKMQSLLPGPPHKNNPTHMMLSPPAAALLSTAPLIAVGTVDSAGQVWSSLWGGEGGLSQQLGSSIVGIKTRVDKKYDPVVWALMDGKVDGELVKDEGAGKMISGLPIDLAARRRQKLFGRKVAGAVMPGRDTDGEPLSGQDGVGEIQMAVRIDQSLGNCPKYLNSRNITPVVPAPHLVSEDASLPQEALDIIAQADMLFVSSANNDEDMDTNHRGGPPGFIRTIKGDDGTWYVVWPEYSGNGLYQTLGNLTINPKAGLVIPDFETGNVVYLTGATEILIGKDAAEIMQRTGTVIKVRVTQAKVVLNGLPFRGELTERSPYNPKVRPLTSEAESDTDASANATTPIHVVSQTAITPSISRFRFAFNDDEKKTAWRPGQWAALDFSAELGHEWSHMMDDDPQALNDDFIRTFTVSNPPPSAPSSSRPGFVEPTPGATVSEFEITIRSVGNATRWLFRQHGRGAPDLSLRGFGGADGQQIVQAPGSSAGPQYAGETVKTGFIAAGIGITPVLAQLPFLDLSRLTVFWTLRLEDIDLVSDTIERYHQNSGSGASAAGSAGQAAAESGTAGVAPCLRVYFTGVTETMQMQKQAQLDVLKTQVGQVELRRMKKEDLELDGDASSASPSVRWASKWFACVTPQLLSVIEGWLEIGTAVGSDGQKRELIFEDFY